MEKTLVVIVGPPAVGKMTVGLALSEITGFPLFHNHLGIEAVLPVFPFGSEPFGRLVSNFRFDVFREVAASELPGLIVTYVWAFDQAADREYVDRMRATFEEKGWCTAFVELEADLEARLRRNQETSRLGAKPSKRDLVASRERLLDNEKRYRLNSGSEVPFPLPHHLRIDNTEVPPLEAAERIVQHFGLPRS